MSGEPDTELITAVEVTPANVGDGQVAMELLKQQAEVLGPVSRMHSPGSWPRADGRQVLADVDHLGRQWTHQRGQRHLQVDPAWPGAWEGAASGLSSAPFALAGPLSQPRGEGTLERRGSLNGLE